MMRLVCIGAESTAWETIKLKLESDGWQVFPAVNHIEGLTKVKFYNPRLAVLNHLPENNHTEDFLKRLREWSATPVIILSTESLCSEKRTRLLNLGADDCLPQPFDYEELKVRVNAVVRRTAPEMAEAQNRYQCDGFEMDFSGRTVRLEGEEVALNPQEFEAMRLLVNNAGSLVPAQVMMKHIWGEGRHNRHYVQVVIHRLRKKLGRKKDWIINVHGVGYKFMPSPADSGDSEEVKKFD